MATPTRPTGARPMTPNPGERTLTARLVQPPVRHQGSRMTPFPPHLQSQQLILQSSPEHCDGNCFRPLCDYYDCGRERGPKCWASVGGIASPSIPKTPKQRQPVKGGAKPTGLVHPGKAFPCPYAAVHTGRRYRACTGPRRSLESSWTELDLRM